MGLIYNYDSNKVIDPIQRASIYGSKRELIEALELSIEELKLL